MIGAVVDLGSNTFHLLISKVEGDIEELYRERIFVGLSAGGVQEIRENKITLGLEACRHFKSIIDRYKVDRLSVIGTAVLRSASNRQEFLNPASKIFSQPIEVISGSREAELIYKGVQWLPIPFKGSLIMDIGGGSVEFIAVEDDMETYHTFSFMIGLGVLFSEFKSSDPILKSEYAVIKEFILNEIGPLIKVLKQRKVSSLIGASGTFEVIADYLRTINRDPSQYVDQKEISEVMSKVIFSSLEERRSMKFIPDNRLELIVVALILLETIVDAFKPDKIYYSPYALKEGVLKEWQQNG